MKLKNILWKYGRRLAPSVLILLSGYTISFSSTNSDCLKWKGWLGTGYYNSENPLTGKTSKINGISGGLGLEMLGLFDNSVFDIYAVNVDFKGSKYYYNVSDKDLNESMKEELSVLSGSVDISTKRRIYSSVNIGPFLGYQHQWINHSGEYERHSNTINYHQNFHNNSILGGLGLDLGRFNIAPYYKINLRDNAYSGFGSKLFLYDLFLSGISFSSEINYNNNETSWGIGLILGKRNGPNFEFRGDKTYYSDKNISPTYGFYFGINDGI